MATLGQRIQKIRKEKGLSQRELGEKLGVSASMIGQYENDLRNPKPETLEKISNALEVSVWDLYESFSSFTEFYSKINLANMQDSTSGAVLAASEGIKNMAGTVLNQIEAERKLTLNTVFDSLNNVGQKKALDQVEDLAKIPEYQKDKGQP